METVGGGNTILFMKSKKKKKRQILTLKNLPVCNHNLDKTNEHVLIAAAPT